jgi:hypothetical protein
LHFVQEAHGEGAALRVSRVFWGGSFGGGRVWMDLGGGGAGVWRVVCGGGVPREAHAEGAAAR